MAAGEGLLERSRIDELSEGELSEGELSEGELSEGDARPSTSEPSMTYCRRGAFSRLLEKASSRR